MLPITFCIEYGKKSSKQIKNVVGKVREIKHMNKVIKCIGIVFSVFMLALGMANTVRADGITNSDFLKTNGTSLRNESGKGNRVLLRGVNVGGWFIQELWMCPTKETKTVKDQKTIESTLTDRFGQEKADELLNVYYDNFWTTKDFDNCQEMGMNCLRLPIWHYNIIDKNGEVREDAFERIDWFVSEAGKRGMYVIIDMHGAPGSQNDKDHSGDVNSNKGLWQGTDVMYNQNLFIQIWKLIAEHYNGNPIVAGYDLLNEPYCAAGEYTDSTVWDLYDRAYDAIRQVDKNHVIIMEGTWEPYNLPNPVKYGWSNVMYEYHCYNYDSQTNAEDQLETVKRKIQTIQMMDYNVPSYIGETSFFSNPESWEKCLSELNSHDISWTLWTYKVTGSGNNSWGIYNMPISDADVTKDSYEEIAAKWQACNTENAVENKEIKPIIEKFIFYSPNQMKIGGAVIHSVSNQVYTGREVKPDLTITLNNKILVKGTDYTVRYVNNIQCGTAQIIITGAGKYDGILKTSFKIVPSKVEIRNKKITQSEKSISLVWKKNLNADGYFIYQYTKGKYKKIKSLKSYHTTCKISKLKAGTKYKFKIVPYKVIDGKTYEGESRIVSRATQTKAVKIRTRKKGRKVKILWKKVRGADGYKVCVSKKRKGKYKAVKKVASKTFTYRFKKKGTYHIKVYSYIKIGKQLIYGKSSHAKRIVVK